MRKRTFYLLPLLFLAAARAWAQAVRDDGDIPTGADADFQASTTTIRASWEMVTGPFLWAIGTSPGGEEVQPFTATGITGQSAEALGLSLTPGALYYVTVQDGPAPYYSDGITVGVGPPAVAPAAGPAPLAVSFRQHLEGVILYEWDFDVGAAWKPDLSSPVSGDAAFVYTLPGMFTAELRMLHAGGEILAQPVQVQIAPPPQEPTAGIVTVPAPPNGPAPLAVTFTATTWTFDGTVLAWLWDFDGDGAPDASHDSSPSIAHTFGAPGTYAVGLAAVDAAGSVATATATVTVDPPVGMTPPSVAWTDITPPLAQVGDVVSFSAQGQSGGAEDVVAFHWDFDGDGETDRITPVPAGNATYTATETWQFEGPFTYSPRVVVFDAEGLSAGAAAAVDVLLEPAVPRCWILQPFQGAALFGDHVTLLATAIPPASVTGIEFKYRPAGGSPFPAPGDASWIPIGTAPAESDLVFGLHWDVSTLAAGNYDLIAVATYADGTTDISSAALREITVSVSATEAGADVAEYSGSPVTSLLLSRVSPVATTNVAITRNMVVRVPAGSVPSYAQMRIERRGENPHPVEARLQGLKFLPGHFRRVGLLGAARLGKPSRTAMYLGPTQGTRLADGTDLSRATFKIFRFNNARSRWEPLPNQVNSPRQGLVKASLTTTGDLGVAAFLDRDETGDSSSGCGGLGAEAALLAWLLLRRRRRKAPTDGRDQR